MTDSMDNCSSGFSYADLLGENLACYVSTVPRDILNKLLTEVQKSLKSKKPTCRFHVELVVKELD